MAIVSDTNATTSRLETQEQAYMVLGLFTKKVSLDGWQVVDDLSPESVDLPCPWCSSPTSALATQCPACFHPFG
jgi:hypothetical protein